MHMLRPFSRLLLFVAVAVLAVGCDGFEAGTPPDEVEDTAPVVQFSSSNTGAIPSDSVVTLTVELLNPNGNRVSVEILFAEQASSATTDDFDGSISRVTEVVFDGTDPGSSDVNIDISEADISDGRKEALFALQNAQSSGPVALGDPNQFTLNIGFPPVTDIRNGGVGSSGTFEAVVTEVSDDAVRVQDATAGILISRRDDFASDVTLGDLVRVSGTVSEFAGQLQIDSDDLASYAIVSSDNDLPDAQTITLAEAAENVAEYESERVRIEDLTFSTSGTFTTGGSDANYTVTDPDGTTLTVRIVDDSFYDGEPIPTGAVTFEGVLGQFFGNVQLRARYEGDLTVQ